MAQRDRLSIKRKAHLASPLPCKELFAKLGYLLRTFPVLSETFVSGEIRAVAELTGHAPVVAAMYRPGAGQEGTWCTSGNDQVLYWRDIDKRLLPELASAWGQLFSTAPARTSACLMRSFPGLALSDRVKAAGLALHFLRNGVSHLHSHFAWEQADMLAYLRRLAGLPYSLTLHAADIFVDSGKLARRVADASFVATISDYNRRLLLERFDLPSSRVHVVHCGVDLTALNREPLPQSSTPLIVSLGRMVPKKGFDILLQALALLGSQGMTVRAELLGDGPMRQDLIYMAGELGLSETVSFPGSVMPVQAVSRIRNADVFVLACRVGPDGDMDGIPVVLMEAMALGRPVVSTRLSGIPELVEEGCGLLAEPGDAQSLAGCIRTMLTDKDMAIQCAAAGRLQVERAFSLEFQACRIMELVTASQRSAQP